MGEILEEVKLWNTPIIGAYLLWRFSTGYCSTHPSGDAPVGLLHFIATAILTSPKLSGPISNKRANLQSYIRSFEDSKNSDILLSIHDRIKDKMAYTMKAIDIAVSRELLFWDFETAKLYPKNNLRKASRGNALRNSHEQNGNKAEILGKWFGKHNLADIAQYLKIVF
ncbi:hypothetical protein GO495_06405 [Chitinophaga oryziterrae]|uniref:Uncharacterized protein n=1 Tax=Chitinophaga oryziterrae TaxID=1031224 RepID=A0A6N8J4N1_9BACT|nr:three component ABC system middle component [Chitinophaga oryziterrae]MVT40205.1 hypothetical protein [Chitinophaga oryziterrae]